MLLAGFAWTVLSNPGAYGIGLSQDTSFTTQDQIHQLNLNESNKSEIGGPEIHKFRLFLRAGQFVRLIVRRNGIDVKVHVIPPEPALSFQLENRAGPYSAIAGFISAASTGIYRFEIRPKTKWAKRGFYEIEVAELGSPSAMEQSKLLAQQKNIDGQRQQLLQSTEFKRQALTNFDEALRLWTETGDFFEQGNTLQLMAQAYGELKDLAQTKEYCAKALASRELDSQARPYTLLDCAQLISPLQSPRDSIQLFEQALSSFRQNRNSHGEALTLLEIGLLHMSLFQWKSAQGFLELASKINQQDAAVYEQLRVVNALGGVYDNLGQSQEALRLYDEARAGFRRFGDPVREGNIYINIGVIHDAWGESTEALHSYNEALRLLDVGLAAGEADSAYVDRKKASLFYNRGSLYITLGDFQQGRYDLQQSLELRPPTARGSTLGWFAYAALLEGNAVEALKYCEDALKTQQPRTPRRAQTYTVMGMAHQLLGDHRKALDLFNEAFEIQSNHETLDLKGLAITLEKRGITLAALGDSAKARTDLDKAIALWRQFKDANGEASSLFQLARIERDAGNHEVGLSLVQSATKLSESLRQNVTQQLRASYFATKVDYYELSIDLTLKSSRNSADDGPTKAAFELSERERARGLLETLSSTGLDSSTITDPGLSSLVKQWKAVRRSELEKISKRSSLLQSKKESESVSSIDSEIAKLESELSGIERELKSKHPHYAGLVLAEPISTEETQKNLDPDTLLLEYALGEKRSYVFAVTQNSIQAFELPARDQIEPLAHRFLQNITAQNSEVKGETPQQRRARLAQALLAQYELASALSKMVLPPAVYPEGTKRLVIVADGALQFVPFAALPFAATASAPTQLQQQRGTLIEKYEIVSLPSASVLALQRRELATRKPAPRSVAVLADPVFDVQDQRVARAIAAQKKGKTPTRQAPEASPQNKTSPPKPNEAFVSALRDVGLDPEKTMRRLALSRTEAMEIARVVPQQESFQALDFRASRATALSGELSKYRYVHFATHGVLDLERPDLSGIVLSMVDDKGQKQDGYLRLYEIYNLNLPAELVVLSACETGIGKQVKGEGLIALTRGFMYAGAARVIASLWKVDDVATAELMSQFYKEMFTNKKPPAAALRAAQRYMSEQPRWQSPYYWAGFVLQGEWR